MMLWSKIIDKAIALVPLSSIIAQNVHNFNTLLKSSSFKVGNQLYVKLSYVKSLSVLLPDIAHVSMGYSLALFGFDKLIARAPFKGVDSDKTVIKSVVFLYVVE